MGGSLDQGACRDNAVLYINLLNHLNNLRDKLAYYDY